MSAKLEEVKAQLVKRAANAAKAAAAAEADLQLLAAIVGAGLPCPDRIDGNCSATEAWCSYGQGMGGKPCTVQEVVDVLSVWRPSDLLVFEGGATSLVPHYRAPLAKDADRCVREGVDVVQHGMPVTTLRAFLPARRHGLPRDLLLKFHVQLPRELTASRECHTLRAIQGRDVRQYVTVRRLEGVIREHASPQTQVHSINWWVPDERSLHLSTIVDTDTLLEILREHC